MPTLLNHGHERYVRARAKGAGRLAAYVEAGYRPAYTSAARLERRPDVAARLAELRERDPDIVAPEAVIARLVRLVEACGALGTAPALKEARIALLEAHKLQAQLSARSDEEAFHREPDRELSLEEWLMIWGTDEDKRKLLAGEHFCQAMAARTTNPGDAFAVAS